MNRMIAWFAENHVASNLLMFGILFAAFFLLFGKRLPDVARSLGKGIVEFKKGVRGIEDEVENSVHSSPPPAESHDSGSQTSKETSKESASSASDSYRD